MAIYGRSSVSNTVSEVVQSAGKFNLKRVLTIFAAVLGLVTFFGSYVTIPAGSRGVVTHFGKVQPGVLDEGIHLKMPFVTDVHTISVRVRKDEVNTDAASKDLQKVTVKLALNWNIDSNKVNDLFQSVGDESAIVNGVITPAVSEVLKAATAKLTAEEILTRRIELKQNIDDSLATRLKGYNLNVRDVSLTEIDFTAEFNHAVESKQISEQKSKQAEYEAQKAKIDATAAVNKAEGEAKATLAKARAEAEANSLKLKTLTSELIQYETIQKWDGALPQVVSGSGGMMISLPKQKTQKEE